MVYSKPNWTKEETSSSQARSEGAEDNSLTSWMDVINRQRRECEGRVRLRNEKLDKIINELEAVDLAWYLNHVEGVQIARYNKRIVEEAEKHDSVSFVKILKHSRQELKRKIVEREMIPILHAFLRAGIVKPVEVK